MVGLPVESFSDPTELNLAWAEVTGIKRCHSEQIGVIGSIAELGRAGYAAIGGDLRQADRGPSGVFTFRNAKRGNPSDVSV